MLIINLKFLDININDMLIINQAARERCEASIYIQAQPQRSPFIRRSCIFLGYDFFIFHIATTCQ